MNRHHRRRRVAFSMIEVIIVIGLIGMLLGLLLPAVQRVRESADRVRCLNNLRQIGTAFQNYHASYGHLPPQPPGSDPQSPDKLLSWMALILPQLDQDVLWQASRAACQADAVPYHNPPHVGYATVVPVYVCPSDGRLSSALHTPGGDYAAFTSYIGIVGSLYGGVVFQQGNQVVLRGAPGALGDVPGIKMTAITDGTSQTIMVGERPPPDSLQAGRWYTHYGSGTERFQVPDIYMSLPTPTFFGDAQCGAAHLVSFGPGRFDNPCDRYHLWSLHPGGGNFLFADGSSRFLSYSAAPLMPALATRAGGEVVPPLD
jgi:prepilin-type processing-associated H-X9-DG protein